MCQSRLPLKKIIYSVCFITLFLSAGCHKILSVAWGIRKPKVETEKSLTHYSNRIHFINSNIYILTSEQKWKNEIAHNNSIPEIRVFNHDGYSVKYKEDHLCNAPAFNFTENICDINNPLVDSSFTLKGEIKELKDLQGNPLQEKLIDNYDYIVCIYWARYIGRLNKDHVAVWEENLNKQTKCRIKVLKINLDIQKSWNE